MKQNYEHCNHEKFKIRYHIIFSTKYRKNFLINQIAEDVKKRASNFESNLNRYGSRNNFEFKQNYQAPKKETTPKRRVRPSDEQLMRGLRKSDEKRIRSQKNNPVYKRKGTKLESMLGM